jgi:hypothetical protein
MASDDVALGTGSESVFLTGPGNELAFGKALSLLGDVDEDGYGELLVGTGSVVAFMLGPASMYPDTLSTTGGTGRTPFGPEHGVRIDDSILAAPPTMSPAFSAVSRAGDFNGDGLRDSAYCRRQHPPDDRCRIFLSRPADAMAGVSVEGFGAGEARVAGGGDTSGDGFADLLFSDTDTTGSLVSSAWVLYGRGTITSLNVQNPGVRGFSIEGGSVISAVALGGDIDGPARDGSSTGDWLVGDTGANGGNGRVSVIFGGEFSR